MKSKKNTTSSEKPFLETISGIGPTTRTRLEEAGYGSKESIALATKAQLTEISGIAEKTAALLIREARARFDLGLKKGIEYEEAAKTRIKLTSSSKAFDELLGGGFETGSVIELAGENECGKTQIAHQLAVNCVKQLDSTEFKPNQLLRTLYLKRWGYRMAKLLSMLPVSRGISQAIGRGIRSESDFVASIILDYRAIKMRPLLPPTHVYRNLQTLYNSYDLFFAKMKRLFDIS
ncbi:MAG: helix-hairpin-helix domain-containing protein [Candidatus Hodarchaeota archaeon]